MHGFLRRARAARAITATPPDYGALATIPSPMEQARSSVWDQLDAEPRDRAATAAWSGPYDRAADALDGDGENPAQP